LLEQQKFYNLIAAKARRTSSAAIYATTPSRDINEVIKHFSYVLDELRGSEVAVDTRKALKISIERKISVYDAHFVGLALDFDVPLITEDKEVLKNCKSIACSMDDFLKNL
jgi:predicted nucleic acid-binding protein